MADPEAPVPPDGGGEAGMTLVELLVGLALLSLIALFIGGGVDALRTMAPVSGRMAAAGEGTIVREHLRRTLGEALAGLPLGGEAPFVGSPTAVAFLAPGDPLLEVGGAYRIELALESGADGLDLVERRGPARDGSAAGGEPTVLLRALAEARFSFAGPVRGAEPEWREDWDGMGTPALVRLDAVPRPGEGTFAPLVVRPGTVLPAASAAPAPAPAPAG